METVPRRVITGSNVEIKDGHGSKTLLYIAAQNGYTDMVTMLNFILIGKFEAIAYQSFCQGKKLLKIFFHLYV